MTFRNRMDLELTNYGLLVDCLFLQIYFYYNAATLIHLPIVRGCFSTTVAEFSSCNSVHMARKHKTFTI